MKMRILKDMGKLEYVRLDHWLNIMEHTRDSKKIKQTNVMRDFKKYVKNVSTFGRSESEVWARFISKFLSKSQISCFHWTKIYW